MRLFYILFLSFPLLFLVFSLFNIDTNNLNFLPYILNDLKNTFVIGFFVTLLSTLYGSALAYFNFRYEYSFSRILDIGVILTMIFPSFVLGMVYSDFSFFNKHFFNIVGLILLLTVSNITYSYIFTKNILFASNNQIIIQLKKLNLNEFGIFKHFYFKLILQAVIISSIFVFSDTISEFGLTYFLGVDTFTTTLYQIWLNLYDINLGLLVLGVYFFVFIIFIFLTRKLFNHRFNFDLKNNSYKKEKPNKSLKVIIYILNLIAVVFGFIIPLYISIKWLIYSKIDYFDLTQTTMNSFLISLSVGVLSLILISKFVEYFWKNKYINDLIISYYALPSIILGVLFIYLIGMIKNYIQFDIYYLWLVFFILAMIYKFIPLGYGNILNNYRFIKKYFLFLDKIKLDFKEKIKIKFNIIKSVYFYSFVLIFIDSFKEFSLNFILKPSELKTLNVAIINKYNMEIYYLSSPYIITEILIILFVLILFNLKKINN